MMMDALQLAHLEASLVAGGIYAILMVLGLFAFRAMSGKPLEARKSILLSITSGLVFSAFVFIGLSNM